MSTAHSDDDGIKPLTTRASTFPTIQRTQTIQFAEDPIRSSDINDDDLSAATPPSPSTVPAWTEALQDRLILVQRELEQAQRRWSASQAHWLEEEQHLLEIRRAHRKSLQQEKVTRKAALIWKAKTLGRPKLSSLRPSRKNSNDVTPMTGLSTTISNDASSDENEVSLQRTNTGSGASAVSGGNGGGGGVLSNAIRKLSMSGRKRSVTAPNTTSGSREMDEESEPRQRFMRMQKATGERRAAEDDVLELGNEQVAFMSFTFL